MSPTLNLLLIDNNDSFTYNIVNIIRKFDNIKLTIVSYGDLFKSSNVHRYEKIIISPGPGNPTEYTYYYTIIKKCLLQQIPILGICLGHQIIANHFGAEIYNLKQVFHGQNKYIKHFNNSKIFEGIPESFQVGVYHSWAVKKETLPPTLKITAISQDEVIMAIEHNNAPIFGVQFHPESYITQYGEKIIHNFLQI